MEISYLKYKLETVRALNRLGDHFKEGVLFKSNRGYADYCPWEEWGDPSIESILNRIKKGEVPEFVQKNLELDLKVIDKPFLNHDFDIKEAKSKVVKIKYRDGIDHLVEKIKESGHERIRIDFNCGLTPKLWDQFVAKLNDGLLEKIEYIEDPWEGSCDIKRVPIAADFLPVKNETQVKVYKPTREFYQGDLKTIYSNCMGHPLGVIQTFLHFSQDTRAYEEYHGIAMPAGYYKDYPVLFDSFDNGLFRPNEFAFNKVFKELEVMKWTPLI